MIAMAEDQRTKANELACPHCGCTRLRPSYKVPFIGYFRRVKFCKDCGRRIVIQVTEKIVDDRPAENIR